MIDFPIGELLDDSICKIWQERRLHADGLICPRCGGTERRLFREQGDFPAYRCRACNGYYTLLTGTVFEKTRHRPATLVLLRGIAQGESTARLARELGLSRKQLHTLWQRLQANLNATAPTAVMAGIAFEADELYQNAAGKNYAASRYRRPADAPIGARVYGTYANDRPPIISVISRETGEQRFWVCNHADTWTCHSLIADSVPTGCTQLYTDAWQHYHGIYPAHATVCHSVHEWARDADGDGCREVHCNTCEETRVALQTYLRTFRGVHKQYLHLYVATDEAMVNTKRVTPQLIRRMRVHSLAAHAGYT